MTLIGGLPAHPLITHAVVVLLPLAALGALLLARPAWRRRFGVLVLLLTVAGVASVPLAVSTGEQLRDVLPPGNPLIAEHEHRADMLLPYAIAFVLLVLATVIVGRQADADEAGAGVRRGAVLLAVLGAVAGLVVTGLVVWIGHAGSTAVWQGVVQ